MHAFLTLIAVIVALPSEMYSSFCEKETIDSVYNEISVKAKDEFGRDADVGIDYLMADWAYGVSLLNMSAYYIDKALAADVHDIVLRADCLSLASAVARLRGDLASAIQYAEECLKIDRESGSEENVSSSLNNIAGLYMTYGDAVMARKYIDEAMDIEQDLGRSSYLAIRYGVASEIYLALDRKLEALSFVDKALLLDSLDGRVSKLAVRRSQKAGVLMAMERYDDALYELEAAIPVFRATNNLNSLAISLAQSGEIKMKKGQKTMAEAAFAECIDVCESTDNMYIESRGRKGMWQLYRDTDPYKAIAHIERYVDIQARLNSDKVGEQMQAFNVRYETLKKEQIITIQKQRLLWTGVLVVMLAVILFISVVLFIMNARTNAAIEQKNALLVKAIIDKDRLLALSRKTLPMEISKELKDIASQDLSLPNISLTSREQEIAELCAKGMLNKEIALQLGISQRTVEAHKNNLFRKLGINNTVELMRYMQMRFAENQK